jgi:hypothetical protein
LSVQKIGQISGAPVGFISIAGFQECVGKYFKSHGWAKKGNLVTRIEARGENRMFKKRKN